MRISNLLRTMICLAVVISSVSLLIAKEPAPVKKQHSAIKPAPRGGGWWQKRHESMNKKAAKGDIDLVFIGDSITQGWEGKGRAVWKKHYGSRKALNLGIGGDRTQHVLWRLDNGNLKGISPKLAVIMIGTNNSNRQDNNAEEIGDGIVAIINKLQKKTPKTKILLLAVFPRGAKPSPQREKNAKASAIGGKLADGKNIFYLDIGPNFLTKDKVLTREIMPDLLHLSTKGYQIWADSIEAKVAELLGEKEKTTK